MSYESRDSLQTIFYKAFQSSVLHKAEIDKYLPDYPLQFNLGEEITLPNGQAPFRLCLLEGKIRLLERLSPEKEKTLFSLESGSVLASENLQAGRIRLLASSKRVSLVFLPAELFRQIPALEAMLQESPFVSADAASAQLNFERALEKASEYFQINVNIPNHPLKLPELARIFQGCGLEAKENILTRSQIESCEDPLIVQDELGHLHWVAKNGAWSFEEPESSKPQKYRCLSLKQAQRLPEAASEEPYSASWYFKLFTQNWLLSGQMVLASILLQVFTLGTPFFYMVIFDRVFGRQNFSTLDVMTLGMAMLTMFDISVRLLRSFVLSHKLQLIDRAGAEVFLEKLFSLPLAKATREVTRAYGERFSELFKSNQIIAACLFMHSLDLIFSLLVIAILIILSPKLALISLASLVPIALLIFFLSPRIQKRSLAYAQEQRQNQLKLNEFLEGIETVKSVNASKSLKSKIMDSLEGSLKKGFGYRFDQLNEGTFMNFIGTAGSILTLYVGAHEVLEGKITYGVYMAINMISRLVIGSVQKLFSSFLKFQEALNAIRQLRALQGEHGEYQIKPHGVQLSRVRGEIKIVDLSFRYNPEAVWALRDLNLQIEPGSKVILTGRSGSGKTTLIRLLQRFYELNKGYISLDEYNLNDFNLENLRGSIGVALQKPAIFGGSIKENIALGRPDATMREIVEVASSVGLDEFMVKLPQGFDTALLPMGSNLSGGQAARIALARILLMNPKVLVLDEALSFLDPSSNAAIFGRILQKYKNATCIFVTDFLPIHRKADQIIVLHEGKVVEVGDYNRLMAAKNYYYHLFAPEVATA